MENRRSIQNEDLFLFFLEITMILGEKERKGKANRSEDLFFILEITMILGKKREMRDQSPFLFREHQVLEILASGP